MRFFIFLSRPQNHFLFCFLLSAMWICLLRKWFRQTLSDNCVMSCAFRIAISQCRVGCGARNSVVRSPFKCFLSFLRSARMSASEQPQNRVLSIQSHVVHGYCGNKSAVFPLQVSFASFDSADLVSPKIRSYRSSSCWTLMSMPSIRCNYATTPATRPSRARCWARSTLRNCSTDSSLTISTSATRICWLGTWATTSSSAKSAESLSSCANRIQTWFTVSR